MQHFRLIARKATDCVNEGQIYKSSTIHMQVPQIIQLREFIIK